LSTWLVDAHALIWFLNDDPALSETAAATMESPYERLLVSAASLWEIAIKAGLGKLEIPEPLVDVLEQHGFESLPVAAAHAWEVSRLPVVDHRDPFDRLLAAQARLEELPIISADTDFDQYGVERHW
jgi:PIN domain nuclease of toxin-antitoxin system